MDMNMGNIGNKLMNKFFRRVDGVVWDLMTGKLGVQCNDGIATLEGEGDEAQISISLFDQFGIAVPAFAQNTATIAVNTGDLVVGDRGIQGWVIEKKEKQLVLMKPDGQRSTMTPPKITMMGMDSNVMVLKSLVNMLPGGTGGLGQMQSMLLPMLMMGGDSESMNFDAIMPLLLMNMTGTTGDPAGGNNMMQMMLMMSMMKSGGLGNMFGGPSKNGQKQLTNDGKNNFFDKRS